MREIGEKISYLQGLCEGMNISESSAQGRIIHGILAILEDLSSEVNDVKNTLIDFQDYVQSIDDDLFDLQENLADDEEYGDYIDLTCSKCGEDLYFDADILDEEDKIEIICPSCNEVVFVHDGGFDFETYIDEGGESETSSQHN